MITRTGLRLALALPASGLHLLVSMALRPWQGAGMEDAMDRLRRLSEQEAERSARSAWRIDERATDHLDHPVIVDGDGHAVCETSQDDGLYGRHRARLIAGAPELRAALEQRVANCRCRGWVVPCSMCLDHADLLERVGPTSSPVVT